MVEIYSHFSCKEHSHVISPLYIYIYIYRERERGPTFLFCCEPIKYQEEKNNGGNDASSSSSLTKLNSLELENSYPNSTRLENLRVSNFKAQARTRTLFQLEFSSNFQLPMHPLKILYEQKIPNSKYIP